MQWLDKGETGYNVCKVHRLDAWALPLSLWVTRKTDIEMNQYAFIRMADQPDIPIKEGREEEAAKIIKQFGRGSSSSPSKTQPGSTASSPSKRKGIPVVIIEQSKKDSSDDGGSAEGSGEAASTDGNEEGPASNDNESDSGEEVEATLVDKWLDKTEEESEGQ
jgi:hypothetical protein